jgi:predicted phosphodiesterase
LQHVNVALKYKGGDVFTIYPLGDLHVGNASCDMKKFEESINEIKNDDSAIVVMMGDLAECIVPADKKRFNFDEIHPMFQPKIATLPSAYLEYLTDILNPIKNKIIGIHKGNHEGALLKYYFRDIIAELCGNLGVKYLPGMAFTKINFSYLTGGHQQSLIMNTSHGHKAGRKSGAKVNFMEDLPSWIDAQVILRGHSHSLFCNKTIRIGPNAQNTKLIKKEVLVGHTGSFLSTYVSDNTTYAEDQDYAPSPIGTLKIFVELNNGSYDLSYKIK